MKKLFFFGALFAAGLSFTACSSDNDVAGDPITNNSTGDRFLSLSIVLPNDGASTRAVNDNFKNGLAAEFAVNTLKVLVFEGNSTTAVLKEVITPDLGSWTNNAEGSNVTTRQAFVSKLTNTISTPYVLAVLNDNGLSYTVNTTTYADILAATTSSYVNTVSSTGYFTMTNSPLANVAGGSNDPSSAVVNTLVQASVYTSEAAANAATPNEIYVERIAAKVTVENNAATSTSITTTEDSKAGTIQWWAIDNTESSAYFVRNVSEKVKGYFGYLNSHVSSNDYKYRFIGTSAISSQYRIYWAEDPNYSGTGLASSCLTPYSDANKSTGLGSSNPRYCLENTFDLSNQTFNHTTRVVLAVQFNSGTDFYVINGATGTLNDEATVISHLQTAVLNNSQVHAIIAASSETWVSTEIGITLSSVDANGVVTISDIAWNHTGTALTASLNAIKSSVISAVNTSNKVEFYDDGLSYYTIRIKHFGDDLTPWATSYNTGGGIYDFDGNGSITSADEKEYLGRYGVVRNNWYNINVSSIKRIGSPVVTSVSGDTTTDDTEDQYISYAINILAWAYRNQNADL